MKEIDLKELIEKVNAFIVNPKDVEWKVFHDYLLDKRNNGQFQNGVITFDDDDDLALFEELADNLGIDIANFL